MRLMLVNGQKESKISTENYIKTSELLGRKIGKNTVLSAHSIIHFFAKLFLEELSPVLTLLYFVFPFVVKTYNIFWFRIK